MDKQKIKATATIEILYTGPDATAEIVSHLISSAFETAMDRGMMTEGFNLEVEESTFTISAEKKGDGELA
jgi:hypothetical protein